MDALQILIPYFVLMACYIWAERYAWCFVWTAICAVVICAEIVCALNPALWLAILITGAFSGLIWFLLFMAWKFNKKRTISNDVWALFKKSSPEYNLWKGWACVLGWLQFAIFLAVHFLIKLGK